MPDQARHDEGECGVIGLALLLAAAQPVDCRNAMTQADIDACAGQEARDAEADMQRAAAQLMREFQARDRTAGNRTGEERLRAAQRAWIGYRDAQCALAGMEAMGGSLEETLVAACLADMNGRRAVDLRLMLDRR